MTTLKTINPKNNELLAELTITSNAEIDAMIQTAKSAQKDWGLLSVEQRAKPILSAYKEIVDRKAEFAELIHNEMGKTMAEALGEVTAYTGGIQRMVEEVTEAIQATTREEGGVRTTTFYDPLGVCASITPWNFPLGMPHTLMMPSLLSGNTILFKPSEEVPLIGIKYAEVLNNHLPPGVLQTVIGAGEQGKYLVESDVQLITFTGSQATGKHILASAGKGLKRVLLELGGKDPLIVMEDADLEQAAKFAATNSFRNAGQVCVSTEQIFISANQKAEFIDKLKKFAETITIGSMIHKKQEDHVRAQVKDAIAKGAVLEYGDINSERIQPMILSNVKADMDIMIDETFGPVACVVDVDSADEAVSIANNTNYALGGVIFSGNTKAAHQLGRQLKVGMVGINRGVSGAKGSPWVGASQSVYGFHGSVAGHRQFTQIRILSEPVS